MLYYSVFNTKPRSYCTAESAPFSSVLVTSSSCKGSVCALEASVLVPPLAIRVAKAGNMLALNASLVLG